MEYPKDDRVLESFNDMCDNLHGKLDRDISNMIGDLPEMTPIEQIVHFTLAWMLIPSGWILEPQKQIGNYRVDFLITNIKSGEKFVIECDGHDFHERTKDQAQRDKERDRNLQAKGFKVFRFTGSEIWKTLGHCVIDSLVA